jgi:hypothetical protein
MQKFLWGALVGVIGFLCASAVMSLIIFVMENKILGASISFGKIIAFSLQWQALVWLVLIPLAGMLSLRFNLRASVYLSLTCIVLCGALWGCYLGAVVL